MVRYTWNTREMDWNSDREDERTDAEHRGRSIQINSNAIALRDILD